MSERVETHDFMSVDSFAQLPFIRPSAAKPSPTSNSTTAASNSSNIRLFGFDLPPDHNKGSPSEEEDDDEEEEGGANATAAASVAASAAGGGSGSESGRKFECHYCCRNFPTSQALGGHQNAHKRERQHAKRAHLQSALAAAHHHHHTPIAEGHVYGILNYHRFGSSVPSAARFGLDPPPHYPSWGSSPGAPGGGPRFHSGLGSASQPINGNPLPAGLWRVPGGAMGMVVHRDSARSAQALPPNFLAGGIESRPTARMGMGGNYNIAPPSASAASSSSSSAPSRLHDSVSLDLHL